MSITFVAEWQEGDQSMDDTSLNVSNGNAFRLLTALGVEPDYCGSMPAAEMRERILSALALDRSEHLDVTDPATNAMLGALGVVHPNLEDCNHWIMYASGPQCGHGGPKVYTNTDYEGYVEEKLTQLMTVVDAASKLGRDIQWC